MELVEGGNWLAGEVRHKAYLCSDCRKARNRLRSMADKIAGGRTRRFALPKEDREAIWETAQHLHTIGADFTAARKAESVECRGFVYVIDHPRLPGVKIGRAYDPESRLRNYQTGCPERAYRLRHATYFEDCRAAEADIHARLNDHQLEGEWFAITPDEGQECIEAFARLEAHQSETIS